MEFKPNYPIYLQVADFICEKVLTRAWRNGEKLPSVKDLSVMVSVNPNTVIKALAWLQENGILITQRGIGYFLSEEAFELTLRLKRRKFIEEELPDVFASMELLKLDVGDLVRLYEEAGSGEKV